MEVRLYLVTSNRAFFWHLPLEHDGQTSFYSLVTSSDLKNHAVSKNFRTVSGQQVNGVVLQISGLEPVLGTCVELDAFVSIPDEGDMTFLRKKVKSGAAVGKLVLLQVFVQSRKNVGVFHLVDFSFDLLLTFSPRTSILSIILDTSTVVHSTMFILSPRIVPSFGTYLWNMMDKRLITLLVTSSDFEESCRQPCVGSIVDSEVLLIELEVGIVDCFWTAGTCGELDAFVSIPDEGDMTFLRKKGKSGAAVGKLVLLQVFVQWVEVLKHG
ncbi:hypothetical protein Tco_0523321 [Tanacetum coccineum]